MIGRRVFSAGMGAMLMAPSISRGAAASTLKFIPQSDLTILDPIITTVYTARNHGYMVFDTLFGMNGHYQTEPQMLDGVSVENDGPLRVASFRLTGPYHSGG
jgi:peptide/nickel transport system substrate-binding protein